MKTAKEYCSELLIYLLAVSRPTFESVAGGGGVGGGGGLSLDLSVKGFSGISKND